MHDAVFIFIDKNTLKYLFSLYTATCQIVIDASIMLIFFFIIPA